LFFGAWAIHWNANAAEYHASAPEFALFAAVTTILLIIAYAIFTIVRCEPIRIHPAEAIPLGLLAAFFFVFRAAEQPIALCILPVLMGVTFFGLRRNRQRETGESLLGQPLDPVPGGSLAALGLIPLSAAAVYVPAAWLGWRIPTNILFYILLMPAGCVLYFASLAGIFRDRRGSIDRRGL
jgi:energy-converting hydrogenase Eha subunit C